MKHWIQAARLRTLPLSVSGILVGSFYAFANQTNVISEISNWIIFGFSLLTTLGFQVLSNFANDYGDGVKGTDNEHRIGPMRAIQSGKISVESMKKAIIITSVLTLISASVLIYFAFKNSNFGYSLFFLFLGIIAIIAAVKYTVGNSAYGYKGFGDVFVFIFFGLVSTLGVNFLYSKQIDLQLILPACAIGLLSVGVLNLNNMRDEISDRNSNKNTIVVKMGGKKAKVYHYILIISAMLITLIFAIIYNGTGFRISQYAFLVAYFPLISHIKTVYYCSEPRNLDPELKKLAISTFLLSVILSIVMLF
ncbi:1,4-dihydroxy-2-naphthoate octaprenyltransferase [Flavobacterium sp.]|uniref:1,4-dihydroxy-2-naphthoate octaprenyltransferase n=1 Tax=Flavobacterium sp. TaxID=239 RepID=UPI00286AC5B1|nr:1,4-dihydroxy-2-naphthoate octaprenyltransferase [Flavobacterium sp.]